MARSWDFLVVGNKSCRKRQLFVVPVGSSWLQSLRCLSFYFFLLARYQDTGLYVLINVTDSFHLFERMEIWESHRSIVVDSLLDLLCTIIPS